MPVLFHEWVGPFPTVTFAIVYKQADGGWRLVFDEGNEYQVDDIFAHDTLCFKIPAHQIAEIQVIASYEGQMGLQGHISPQTDRELKLDKTAHRSAVRIPPQCGVVGCSPPNRACPPEGGNPNATMPKCVEGQLMCVEPERDHQGGG